MTRPLIIVAVTVAAPALRVWTAWTQPEHITHWNFASDDWECPSASADLRPGGVFSSRMAAKDGSMAFDFSGVYREVAPLERLSYELDDGRQVRIDFERLPNDQTRLTEEFEAEDQHAGELQRSGWQAILENFRRYTESLPG
jgi:uncharacterized protein YndB with AHSA1/START domain